MEIAELCTSALRLAGVGGVGRAPSAEEMNIAISALNQMLFSWGIDGLDLGWQTAAQFDDLLVDDAYVKAIRYSLAVELAAEFKRDLNPAVAAIAIDEMEKVRAALSDIDVQRLDPLVVRGSRGRFDYSRGY
jgi:hypothetical protein